MSLFSDDPNASPADRAIDMLYNRAGIWHDGLKWRTDALRTLADQLDSLDELIQDGVGIILTDLGAQLRPHDQEQESKLEADHNR